MAVSSTPTVRTASPLAAVLRRHPITGFFVLAYGLSWLELLVVAGLFRLPAGLAIALTTFAPAAAGVTMAALTGGRPAVAALLRRLLAWRFGWQWYALALVGLPVLYLAAAMALSGGVGLAVPPLLRTIVTYAIVFALGLLLGGPLGEEPGWRGFALPRLQQRFGPLNGALLLGALWGAWHLPQFLVGAWAAQNGGLTVPAVLLFLALVPAISVVLAFLYNITGGSLLAVVLAHAGINTAQAALVDVLLPGAGANGAYALAAFGLAAIAIVVLTRGRLGLS